MFPMAPSGSSVSSLRCPRPSGPRLATLALVAAAGLVGCSSSGGATPADAGAHDSAAKDASSKAPGDALVADSGSTEGGAAAARGPKAIAMSGADPNGLFWDATTETLYIADNANDRVMTWTDKAGLQVLVTLPGPAGNDVGGIVRLADGTLVVAEFGFGTSGLVALVHPDGSTSTVPGLDPTKRRIGLAVAPDGSVYDCYFNKVNGAQTGFVAKLDVVAGTETDIITGLGKPVGVAVAGSTLLIGDQSAEEILAAPLGSPQAYVALATKLSPDLLSAGPTGTIFSGSPTGVVYQIDTTTGAVSTLFTAGGTLEPRGTAYDAKNRRLFVAEHDSSDIAHYLEIVPVGE